MVSAWYLIGYRGNVLNLAFSWVDKTRSGLPSLVFYWEPQHAASTDCVIMSGLDSHTLNFVLSLGCAVLDQKLVGYHNAGPPTCGHPVNL